MTTSTQTASSAKVAQTRRRRALFVRAMKTLEQWGFGEIEVPLLAPWSELRSAIGEDMERELFRFPGRSGELRVLRGDITPMIAWQYANHLQRQPLPMRVAYAKRIARVRREFARERIESYQLGAELIGREGPRADAELLVVLFDLLDELGLHDGEIRIGHVGIAEHIVRAASANEDVQDRLFAAIGRRDRYEVDLVTKDLDLDEKTKSALRRLCGVVPDFYDLERLSDLNNPAVDKSVAELVAVTDLLEELGYRERVMLDLTRRNDRGYYTGVIFRVVAERAETPLGSGGRYDSLIGQFGDDLPAVGFGLDADLLVSLVESSQEAEASRTPQVFKEDNAADTIRKALEARQKGAFVRVDTDEEG